jgi:hypothetical protein
MTAQPKPPKCRGVIIEMQPVPQKSGASAPRKDVQKECGLLAPGPLLSNNVNAANGLYPVKPRDLRGRSL